MIGETLKSLAFNKTYGQNIQIHLDENIFSFHKSSQILTRIGSNDQIFQSDSKNTAHARPVYVMWSLNGVLMRHALKETILHIWFWSTKKLIIWAYSGQSLELLKRRRYVIHQRVPPLVFKHFVGRYGFYWKLDTSSFHQWTNLCYR